MHVGWWSVVAFGAWMGSVVMASAAVSATTACTGRPLLAADGQPSDLTDCDLDAQLERASLREHLGACIRQAFQAPERVYGKLKFDLELHAGGGVSAVRFGRSAFRRTCLPDCLARAIRSRLSGPRQGRPANLHGQLSVAPGAELDFGLSLSGMLVPPPKPKPRPLAGAFSRDPDGLWTSCGIGLAQVFLRLDPQNLPARSSWDPAVAPAEIDACLALGEAETADRARKGKRLSARARKRQVTACLTDLLESPSWELRAQAAEELARGWRWRGRRAIQRTVEAALGCPVPVGNGKAQAQAKTKTQAELEAADACRLVAPAGSLAGHALVRMLKAQLRLRRAPREGVMRALAGHGDPRVRLRMVDTVLTHWNTGIPEGLERLVRDPDTLVRARAQQVGCLRSDWGALRAFRADLRSADPRSRAQSLIHARACADRAAADVTEAARREPSPVVALIMLRAVPVQDTELILKRAGPGLFDPCPLVRYLAARLLGRLEQAPLDLVRQALAREPEPLIKRLLSSLATRVKGPGLASVEQLWLQAEGDAPAPRLP